ncbi:hypothetical protein HYU16_00105 [Candidatus Woesearchaeota archaeon]|nr:hypothetical protein [Candidatus Woesearchaeota archaeon]
MANDAETEAKPEAVKTGADRLLELVKGSKEIALADAAQRLGVPVQTVEAWSNFLEEDGLIAVKYKFTTPYLSSPEAPKAAAKNRLLGIVSEGPQGLEGMEKAGELVDVKASVESARELLTKASEEKTIGEFGLLRQTYEDLLAKLRLAHDRLAAQPGIAPQKRVALSEFLKRLDSMLQSAADYVSEGRFDQANISYSGLQKQAEKTAEELNQVYEQIVTVKSVQETKDYKELLEKVYQLMEEGRVEEAKQLYEKLEFARENLAKDFVEKRQNMEEDLVKLNKDLARKVDQLNIKKLGEMSRRINLLLDSGRQFLRKGEFDTAESYYTAIKHEYAKLPPGFAKEKKELQEKVLGFYSSLASQREKELRKAFDRSVKEVQSLIKETHSVISENRIGDAIKLYNRVRTLFARLPRGFLEEKAELQEKILPLYTAITSEYTQESLRRLKSKSADIISLLGMMNERTEKGEIREAEEAYERIKQLYREMPEGFLHEETTLQNQIVQAYEAYLKKARLLETTSFASALSEMSKLLDSAEGELKRGDYDSANGTYLKIISLYDTLPPGFMAQKTEVRGRVLRLYKALLSESYPVSGGLGQAGGKAIGRQQKRPGAATAAATAGSSVSEMIKLITDVHTAVLHGNFRFLQGIMPRLDALSKRLPNLAKISPRIFSRVSDLREELELYKKALSLQALFESKQSRQLKSALDLIKRQCSILVQRCPEDKALFDYITGQHDVWPA